MSEYKFEYPGQFISLETVDEGIKAHCDSSAVECWHLIKPSKYDEFCAELGFPELSDPIEAAKFAVAQNRGVDVQAAIHKVGKVLFAWF